MSEMAGYIDWSDTSFQPEVRQFDDDPIKWFKMSHRWPDNPAPGRKFQLGGKERVALLEEDVYHCWVHRFSVQWHGSAVNGSRRCTRETLGSCVACDHYEEAPKKPDGKKDARCGRRQQQFGTSMLVYKTDLEGRLLTEDNRLIIRDETKGLVTEDGQPAVPVYDVYLWRFSADKFAAIREIKKSWGSLKQHDLQFTLAPGKQENFQDFAPTVMPWSAWRDLGKFNREAAVELVKYYKDHKYEVGKILGKEYSHDEMRGFLFGTGTHQADGSVNRGQPAATDVASEIERELARLNLDGTIDPGVVEPPTPPIPAVAEQPVPVVAENAPGETAPQPAVTVPASADIEDFDKLLASD